MATSQGSRKNKEIEKRETIMRRPFDELFDNFRQDMEDTFFAPFINPLRSAGIQQGIESMETRIPLCDILDKGDRYLISLEVPGIQKDKIEVKATNEYITISGIDDEKTDKEDGNYVLKERTYRSFSRRIPFSENITPTKVDATVENGILKIEIPKQKPTSIEETQIKIK
jgi:HSP20 family protein